MRFLRLRTSIAIFALLGAACAEPLAPKLERIQHQIANAFGCDNTWATPVSGFWSDAGKWSKGTVPTSLEEVCITLAGDYTVTVHDIRFAKAVTISVPGNATKPTLQIAGYNIGAGFGSSTGRLTVMNGIDNFGFLHMTAIGPFPGFTQLILNSGVLHNHDIAEFRAMAGTAPGRLVQADVVNDGTMIFETNASGFRGIRNNALFRISPTGAVSTQDVPVTLAAGSFENNGSYFQNLGAFRLEGGALTGNPPVLNQVALTLGSETIGGKLVMRSHSTLTGNVGKDLEIEIQAYQQAAGFTPSPASLASATGFSNAGVIRLISVGGHLADIASLTAPANATIVNTGRILSQAGVGNTRSINANIDNRAGGLVDMEVTTRYGQQEGTTTNAGTWKVAAGARLMGANGMVWIQDGGTLEIAPGGQFEQVGGGQFHLNGGAITGEPWLNNVAISIAPASTATGGLFVTGGTLTGDIKSGQKITVAEAVLKIPVSLTNHGTLVATVWNGAAGFANIQMLNGATLTNAPGGRVDMKAGPYVSPRNVIGNFVNQGTFNVEALTFFSGGIMRTTGAVTGMGELRNWGATMYASGSMNVNLLNSGAFHIGQTEGAAASLAIGGYFYMHSGSLNVDIGGSVPGTDFDQLTAGDWALSQYTLNVGTTTGGCAGGGSSYEVIKATSHSGDFFTKTGLNLGGGRTATTVSGPTNYVINVSGPVCVPPDVTPPSITPNVTGMLGNNGWYTSDVSITWSVTDAESAVDSKTGCDDAAVTSDNAGVTFTCSATSAGGTATQSVTIKRDATPPVITTSQSPMPNAHGWNNTDVTAFWSATDAMSGLEGAPDKQNVFNGEGLRMNFGGRYFDKAGNEAVALIFASIDRTPPVVSASRAPEANVHGWNNVNVTATYSATDALSGLDGSSGATQLFSSESENQSGSHAFTDKAGNSATASISGISIDKTAPTVEVTRSPAPDATGWNNTDVTATWSASDALSGIDGSNSATHLFNTDGAGQSATRSFSDKAGNSASATISNINIDKTPTPPPPPPTLNPSCSVTPNEIWPANNKMVAVRVTVGGTGVTSFSLRSVVNNETGSGDVTGWTLGTADVDGFVLAKRNGGGTGRTYTLTYDVFGSGGATGSCAVTVRVPHDQGKTK